MAGDERKNAVIEFTGSQDTDSSLLRVKPNDFTGALNFRNGYGTKLGRGQNYKGNNLKSTTLPTGVNTCLGTYEDKRCNSIIYFIQNDIGTHGIYRFWPYDPGTDGAIYKVLETIFLGWDGSHDKITQADLVDGKLLYWTNGRSEKNTLFSGTPMKINMEKASYRRKIFSYEIIADETSFDPGPTPLTIAVSDILTGFVFATKNFTVPAASTLAQGIQYITDQINIGPLAQWADATNCGTFVRIVVNGIQRIVTLTGAGAGSVFFVPTNSYPSPFKEEWLPLIKMPPICEPTPFYIANPAIKENQLFGKVVQFRYQYVYDDGEESSWSPISYIPTNIGDNITGDVQPDQLYNEILIDYTDDLLSDPDWRSLIRKVRLAVRYGNNGQWRLIDTINTNAMGLATQQYTFRNDSVYSVVPSDDTGAAEGTQAIQNQSFVPRACGALRVVADESGASRLVLGAIKENYDIDCVVDATVVVNQNPSSFIYAAPALQGSIKQFKNGGSYDVAIVYKDRFGRSVPALKLGRVNIPFTLASSQDLMRHEINVLLNHVPPTWAYYYHIAITRNQNQNTYVQKAIIDTDYVFIDPSTNRLIAATFAAATHVLFVYDRSVELTTDTYPGVANIFDGKFVFEGFDPERGDRLQVLRDGDASGNFNVWGNIAAVDLLDANWPIVGHYTRVVPAPNPSTESVTERSFVLEKEAIHADLNGFSSAVTNNEYMLVEVYRPIPAQDSLYYEVPGTCKKVINPTLGSRQHEVNPVILLNKADTYVGNGTLVVPNFNAATQMYDFATLSVPLLERKDLYNLSSEEDADHGRVHVEDDTYGERFYYNRFRNSRIFIPDTQINGLATFSGLDYKQVDKECGNIKYLAWVKDVLLAICQFKIQPIYVSKDRVLDIRGGDQLTRTDQLFNLAQELKQNWGVEQVESVVVEEGHVYGWDPYNGVVWRYSSNGLIAISDYGQSIAIKNYAKARLQAGSGLSNNVYGGYERRHKVYYLSFADTKGSTNEDKPITFAFYEEKMNSPDNQGWNGTVSFVPEAYGRMGMFFISFVLGELWIHEHNGVPYNNFYDIQYATNVKFVFNSEPRRYKIPHNIQVQGKGKWVSPIINVGASHQIPGGQRSKILTGNWKNVEDVWGADFLRDGFDTAAVFLAIADPTVRFDTAVMKGRRLKCYAMEITLELEDSSVEGYIDRVDIEYTDSMDTKA